MLAGANEVHAPAQPSGVSHAAASHLRSCRRQPGPLRTSHPLRQPGPPVHYGSHLHSTLTGALGTGRNYVTGSAELRIPLVAPVEATLFGDWGSDLDSGASIPGDPAGARGKPGGQGSLCCLRCLLHPGW